MENKAEESNDEIKEENSNENKISDNDQTSINNLNKNNMNNIYKQFINYDYYIISQNYEKELKSFHKSIMQNIGNINKILFNNNNTEKEYIDLCTSMTDMVNQIETNHNNFYLYSKKIILKMNKNYNKRKKALKKYKIIEENKYSFTFGLISHFKNNNETDDINHQIKNNTFNNKNQVIINNIQNIINTIDNKSNEIITNNLNQNDYSTLLKENQLLKQKLTNINTNQKSEITNYINYIENKIKNDNNINNSQIEEKDEQNKINTNEKKYKNLITVNEISFEFIYKKILKENRDIILNRIISFNLISHKGNEEIENLEKNNKKLSDENNELKEKINALDLELKKTKEEKANIMIKNENIEIKKL